MGGGVDTTTQVGFVPRFVFVFEAKDLVFAIAAF